MPSESDIPDEAEKPARADKVELQRRVGEVLQMRLLGAEFLDVAQHAEAQGWNVSERQLWRYVKAGDDLLARTLDMNRERLLNRHLAQRRALFARAMSTADYATARAVLKDEAELLHLYDVMPAGDPGAAGAAPALDTAGVVQLLAARLQQVDQADLSTVEKSRLTATLADALLRAIGVDVLDKRLEALQAVLMGRKEQAKK
jgi:hypothetical protein